MNIGYFNARGINDIESWFSLEIKELRRLGHEVRVFWLRGKQPTKSDIEWMDIAHYHFAQVADFYKRIGVPFIISPHAHDIWRDEGATLLRASNHPKCKFVTYQSFYHKKKFEEWGVEKPLVYLPMCCRTKLFTREKRYNPYGSYVAGGRLIPKKGIDRLLKHKRHIKVFGDGPLKVEFEKRFPNNTYLGHLKGKQLKNLFEKGSIYFFPSIQTPDGDMDGIANTVKESLLMELQCISSSVAGMPEIKNIHLLDDWSKECIENAIECIPKRANYEGRREILEKFSPDICIDKLISAINEYV